MPTVPCRDLTAPFPSTLSPTRARASQRTTATSAAPRPSAVENGSRARRQRLLSSNADGPAAGIAADCRIWRTWARCRMRARTLGSARMPSMPRPPCCNSASTAPPPPPFHPTHAQMLTCARSRCVPHARTYARTDARARTRALRLPASQRRSGRAHTRVLVPSAVCTHRGDSLASTGPHLRRDSFPRRPVRTRLHFGVARGRASLIQDPHVRRLPVQEPP